MTSYRGGTWNLKVHRKPALVVAEVEELLDERDLDFLCVQEANDYRRGLRTIPGYRYFTGRVPGSQMDGGILVRKGLHTSRRRLHALSMLTWARWKYPGQHWPRTAFSEVIEGIQVWSVHMPPGGPNGGGGEGAAFRSCLAYLERRLKAHGKNPRPRIVWADWNNPAGDNSPHSPRWMAARIGMDVHGSGIDYVLTRGVKVTGLRELHFGHSDHRPKIATFTLKEHR